MAIELKEIQDAIEDGVKVLKKDWEAKRTEDQKAFDAKVEQVLEAVKAASTKEEVEAGIKEAKDAMQEQFDELATSVNGPKVKTEEKNFGMAFKEALTEGHDSLKKAAHEGKSHVIEMKQFNWTDFSGNAPFNTDYRGPITNPYSSFHWRDVVPMGSTDRGHLSYPKEGATTGGADSWAHAGDAATSKPEISPSFAPYSVDVQWIAGLIKGVPVDMLEDLAWLNSFLSLKARNELLKAEDEQIQEGSGTGSDLDGFLTGSNVSTYDGSYSTPIEMIVDAAFRQVSDSFYNADKIVLSNADKISIILNKASTSGLYNLPEGAVGFVNGQLNMLGLQVFSNPGMTSGTALVGDFDQSQFIIRSSPRLRMFEQNGTDAEKNQVLFRIEERVALAIFSSLAFVKISFTS